MALRTLFCVLLLVGGCRRHAPPVPELAAEPPPPPPAAPAPPTVAPPPRAVDPDWPPPLRPSPVAVPVAPPEPVAVDASAPLRALSDGGAGINGDPRGPRPEALNAVMQAALPSIKACLDAALDVAAGADLSVRISYRILPTGHAEGIEISGAPYIASRCVSAVVEGLSFPTFEGSAVNGELPIHYKR